jgi:outer membrane protein TolC
LFSYKSICLIVIFLVFNLCDLCMAQALNHKDVVIDALRHSPNLRMRIEDIRISDAQYRTSFAGLLPSINISSRGERYENLDTRNSANIETIGNEVVGGNQSSWRSSVNLTGQYYFSHWYKKRYETKYYEQLKDSSVHQCDAEAKKVIREVTDNYGSLLEAKLKLDYSTRILRRLKDIVKIKKDAYAVGHYSFEDVLKAETDVVSTEREITRIQKDMTDLLHRLSGYTGGSYFENTVIDPIMFQGEIVPIDEKRAAAGTPEYKVRQKEMEAMRSKATSTRNNLLPDISFYGRYDLFNSSPDGLDASLKDTRPSSYSAGVLISLPLFDGGARLWEWRKNLYEIRKQEESIRATLEERYKDIKTIYDGHHNLTRSYRHFKKLDDQYAKMMSISKKAQSLGERSNLDMLELEKDALSVERDLKITEQTLAVYETQMELELDYNKFLRKYDGNWACSY